MDKDKNKMEKTFSYKGFKIEVIQDTDPESPREWSNLGKMVAFHPRYKLGDENHGFKDQADFNDKVKLMGGKTRYFALALFLYDHSGITISTKPFNDKWDSSPVGFIYVSEEDARKEFPNIQDWKKLKDSVYKVLESEVKIYDQYLQGDIYGYMIENENKDLDRQEDSLWGIYGADEAEQAAKEAVDNLVAEKEALPIQNCRQCRRDYKSELQYCDDCIRFFQAQDNYKNATGIDTRIVPVTELNEWCKELEAIIDMADDQQDIQNTADNLMGNIGAVAK